MILILKINMECKIEFYIWHEILVFSIYTVSRHVLVDKSDNPVALHDPLTGFSPPQFI